MRLQRILALVLSLGSASALVACGGGGSSSGNGGGGGGNTQTPGAGTITLFGIAPNPFLGCSPVAFTITGNDFQTNTGTTAHITWRAIGGLTPFLGGTTDRVVTLANVTTNTTITGMSPETSLCGVASVPVEIDVALESGQSMSSTGLFAFQINAPTITNILPATFPAAIPTAFVVTGTGFAPVGSPARVRFTGSAGALLFADGTQNFIDVLTVVGPADQIAGTTPIATVCGVNAVTLAQLGATIQVFFDDGCCSFNAVPVAVTFTAPVILPPLLTIPAELQNSAVVLAGTGFGPAGTIATVRLIADNNVALFDDGTLNAIDIPGLIGPGGANITFVSPTAAVCGVASLTATLRVISPLGSSCRQTAAGFVTFTAPTVATVNNVFPAVVQAHIPTSVTVQGTGFGPIGGLCSVTFVSDPAGPAIFGDGTQIESAAIPGVVNSGTQITVTTPHATVQGAAFRPASLRIRFQGDSCATSPAGTVRFTAATLTNIVATAPVAGTFFASIPTLFTINGQNFGPVGSEVFVRFIADAGATPFGNGTQNAFEVPAFIATGGLGAGTITGVAPLAAVCPQPTQGSTVRVRFQDDGESSNTVALTFNAPTVATVNNVAPALVPAQIPTSVTIQGTGFGPVGGVCSVVFVSDPAGPAIFGDGTEVESASALGVVNSATQITVTTPHATVQGAAFRPASLRVTLQSGSCASSPANAIRFTAATLTNIVATAPVAGTFFAAVPTSFTINGQNFGPVGSEVFVRFIADSGATPFGNGTQNTFEVPGTIVTGGPGAGTITGVAPLAAVCPQLTQGATTRVRFQDGSESALPNVAMTFTAPTITFAPLGGFSGASPVAFTISGTGFGPPNSLVAVKFTATGGLTPFADGTQNETTVTGTINGAGTTITGFTPLATICGAASVTATVTTTFQGGACASTAAGVAQFNAPTINAVAGFVPAAVPAAFPTSFTINGTGFGTNGHLAQVTFSVGPPATPFNDSASAETTVTGTVGGGGTTITGLTPTVATCPNSILADVRVTLQNGACTAILVSGVNFLAPLVQTNTLVLPLVSLQNPGLFTINGGHFGVGGDQAIVRWTANSPIFGDGTLTSIDAPGSVTSAATITTTLPVARLCAANATASARVILRMGACGDSPAAFVTWTAPAAAVTAPAAVSAYAPAAITIIGTNFPPVGTPATVTFSGGGQVWDNGTTSSVAVATSVSALNTIAIANPPAVYGCANVSAALSVSFGNNNGVSGGCTLASTNLLYQVPATFGILPVSTPALAPLPITVSGVNFPAVGTPVQIRLFATAPAGAAPFAGGTQSSTTIGGTVTAAGQVTFTPPICCINVNTTIQVGLTFQNANCEFITGSFGLLAPTTSGVLPAAQVEFAPTSTTISGSNFPALGTPVQVTFTGGGQVWNAATSTQATVNGSVTIAGSQITIPSPPAAESCVNFVATLTITWSAVSASGCPLVVGTTVNYNAPAVTTVVPTNLPGLGTNPATPISFSGTNFPPNGTPAQVHFVVAGGGGSTPFGGGTLAQVVVNSNVSGGSVALTEPIACASANIVTNTFVTFGNAPCQFAGPSFTFNTAVITSITGGAALPSLAPTAISINAAAGGFQPNATVDVRFTAAVGTPFSGGTLPSASVSATVNAAGTVIGPFTPPAMTLCGPVTAIATPTITFPAATCSLVSPFTVTYVAPAIAAANAFTTVGTGGGVGIARQTITNFFNLTGTGFGPLPGSPPATVRFISLGGLTFAGGTNQIADVPVNILNATTVQGNTPLATALVPFNANVQVFFEDGTCTNLFGPITFNAPPVITSFVNTRPPFQQAAPGTLNANRCLTCVSTPVQVNGANFVAGAGVLIFQTATGSTGPIGTGLLSGQAVAAAQITGGSPTDVTLTDPLTQATVRVTNPDSQVGTFTPVQFSTRDVLANVNASVQAGNNAEMNIAVNPTNSRNAVAFSHSGVGGQMFSAFTLDAGATWTNVQITSAIDGFDVGNANRFVTDPNVATDAFGNFYIAYLEGQLNAGGPIVGTTWRLVLLQSATGGATWANVRVVDSNVVPAGQATLDRNEMGVGLARGGGVTDQAVYVAYHDFPNNQIRVNGFRSTALGNLAAVGFGVTVVNNIVAPGANNYHHPAAAVGPHGELCVSFIERNGNTAPTNIWMNVDPDGLGSGALGFTGQALVTTSNAPNNRIVGPGGYPIPQPNRGYATVPALEVVQAGPFTGRIVIAYDDRFVNDAFPGDQVSFGLRVLTRFTDSFGATWSSPVQAHVLDTRHQWQPWLATDPVTGNLYCTWFDSVNDAANNRAVQRFSSVSTSGGGWVNPLLLSQVATDVATGTDGNDYLEYEGVAVFGGCVYACWCSFTPGNGDVFTAFYQQSP